MPMGEGPVAVLQLPAGKVGDRGFVPHSRIQVPEKQKVSSLLTLKDSKVGSLRGREVACSSSNPPWIEFRILCL